MTSRLKNRSQSIVTGQITVGITAVQLTDVTARRFFLKMLLDSVGTFDVQIAVGGSSAVTLTTGYIFRPQDPLPTPIEVLNLNLLWAIASAAGQTLNYFGEQ